MISRPAVVLALMTTLLLMGCVASSDYMHEARTPKTYTPTDTTAVVVFVRPSSYASGIATTVLDGRGRFLGDSLPSSHFGVQLPPGEHIFVAWAENTAALRATLHPGRVYYVEVSPRMGVLSARVQLLAITPRSESWAELHEWLSESEQYLSDQASGQAYLAKRQEDVAERLRRANEILTEYDAEEMEERTLRPEDGVPPQRGAGGGLPAATVRSGS